MKKIATIILCVLLATMALAQQNGRQPRYTYVMDENILYTANTDEYSLERCHLDVYYPKDAQNLPVMVWFHGGGLVGGNRYVPDELKEKGIIVVSVNYRFMTKGPISNCIDDAAAAVAWTFANIENYGGSREKIYVCGHSAGGYLTSMIGLDKKWLAKYGVDADDIAALMPLSGQAVTHYEHRTQNGGSPLIPTIDEFAPMTYMRADCPPLFIMSGDREQELYGRYEEQAYFWRMMKLVGHKEVYIYEMQGYDHGSMPHPAFPILLKYINKQEAKR